jgi:hypothetical protein
MEFKVGSRAGGTEELHSIHYMKSMVLLVWLHALYIRGRR